jgi:hypothetical protein
VAEREKLCRMAKVHDLLKIWQGGQTQCTTHHESSTTTKQITSIEYISYTEEITNVC